jgi:cell division protein FtsB
MKRKPKTQNELEELREENKQLRELVAQLIQGRIADAIEPAEQLIATRAAD